MDYEPIYVSFNGKPSLVLSTLGDVPLRIAAVKSELTRRKWLVRMLWIWGGVLMLADLIFGYSSLLFFWVGLVTWVIALITTIAAWRRARPGDVPPGCETGRQIIHTLRDDLHPSRGMYGHLDLTGWDRLEKRAIERDTAVGAKVSCYKDEWLSLKMKLWDGSGLRLSAVRHVKRRAGFWKRGARKRKWKPATTKQDYQELRVRIVAGAPEGLPVRSNPMAMVGKRIGNFQIDRCNIAGGVIDLGASSHQPEPAPREVLDVVRFTYGMLTGKTS